MSRWVLFKDYMDTIFCKKNNFCSNTPLVLLLSICEQASDAAADNEETVAPIHKTESIELNEKTLIIP